MKKYRFLKHFLGIDKGTIYQLDNEEIVTALLNTGIVEEVEPKNRFSLKAEDIKKGTGYWYTDEYYTICYDKEWTNAQLDLDRLANNNVFHLEAECYAEVKRNEAVNKYLKCVARHKEARRFVAKFDKIQDNCLFGVYSGELAYNHYSYTQSHPLRYYFHEDDAESIRKELGDECLMLVFGGEW